jgi:hypothetical protein
MRDQSFAARIGSSNCSRDLIVPIVRFEGTRFVCDLIISSHSAGESRLDKTWTKCVGSVDHSADSMGRVAQETDMVLVW